MLETLLLLMAGPISKFESRAPSEDYVSSANIHDAERCIIDIDGFTLPRVHKQADRPGQTTIIYTDINGISVARIDLVQTGPDLRVISWGGPKALAKCAPRK